MRQDETGLPRFVATIVLQSNETELQIIMLDINELVHPIQYNIDVTDSNNKATRAKKEILLILSFKSGFNVLSREPQKHGD